MMEEAFHEVAGYAALLLEALSVMIISLGALDAAYRTLWPWLKNQATEGMRRHAWQSFARWLLLGLEFTLAADVVRTAISPTWNDIGQLAAIAAVRTFLNFFLERDLKEASVEAR